VPSPLPLPPCYGQPVTAFCHDPFYLSSLPSLSLFLRVGLLPSFLFLPAPMLLDSLLFPTLQVLPSLHLLMSIITPLGLPQPYSHLCLQILSPLHCTLRICAPLPPDTTLGPPAPSTCWAAWDAAPSDTRRVALPFDSLLRDLRTHLLLPLLELMLDIHCTS
jgi:hypothetical protein